MENGHLLNAIHMVKDNISKAIWDSHREMAHEIREENEKHRERMKEIISEIHKKNEGLEGLNNLWRNRKMLLLCIVAGVVLAVTGPSGMVYSFINGQAELEDAKKAYHHRRLKE